MSEHACRRSAVPPSSRGRRSPSPRGTARPGPREPGSRIASALRPATWSAEPLDCRAADAHSLLQRLLDKVASTQKFPALKDVLSGPQSDVADLRVMLRAPLSDTVDLTVTSGLRRETGSDRFFGEKNQKTAIYGWKRLFVVSSSVSGPHLEGLISLAVVCHRCACLLAYRSKIKAWNAKHPDRSTSARRERLAGVRCREDSCNSNSVSDEVWEQTRADQLRSVCHDSHR